mgnify:CR=1 FL=1
MLRQPAVSGQFYPGRKDALEEVLGRMVPVIEHKRMAFGVMSPHAGYVYSGKVAGQSFAGIAIPPEIVIIGPNHHGVGHQVAVYHRGSWETPLGKVPIAEELADAILEVNPAAAADTLAHRHEHSLEVQLPFLQFLAREFAIVPLCIGRVPLADLLALGDGLAAALRTRPRLPLIVASTDMTHYESGQEADRKDHLALRHVLDLDPEGLYRTVRDNRISMCGVLPTIVMLRAVLALGATGAELVAYANSGEVTGDQREVVGYAGAVII